MKKDIREIIYRLYEESLQEEPFEEEFREEFEEEVVIGGVYLGKLNGKNIIFVIIDKIGEYFEVLKISQYWELGTASDILYKDEILGMLMIQTSLNFYLKDDEIKKFKKIYQFDKEFVEKLLNYRELDTKSKLEYKELKRGLYYPIRNKWVDKFKEKELEVIKPYHLRIFTILE
ncbi:MAG: hypothetical protein ACK4SW_07235, partial [Sulfurihydrogenibium azorense]